VKPPGLFGPRKPASIRVRLGLALALALAPVLLLGALEAGLAFQRQAADSRTSLIAGAERSAATAKARIESAEVLLQTLGPGSVGLECAQRLAEVTGRIPGYENLIRFDAAGRVACSAADTPADPARATRPWFVRLAAGDAMAVTRNPGVDYARNPSILAGTPVIGPDGHFDGALAAVMSLDSLRPDQSDPSLPPGSEVAVVDAQGHDLSATNPAHFPASFGARLAEPNGKGPELWQGPDLGGQRRQFAAAPLVGGEVFAVLSAPAPGILSWAWVNPVSTLALPLLAFALALTAVLLVAERGVVGWIAYLQRVAAIYARGRFTVRPVRAGQAPPEIRDLAETLDTMAATIVARDADLNEHLAQKDAMLREIHHRVKNNLQVISSLLNMQQRALTDPAARAAMSDTRQRIGALALIYRALYQGPDLRRVDLRAFLEELIGQLVAVEGGLGKPVRTELACDPLVIDPDRLAPLALFAVEAISNARKHGLDADGRLSVTLTLRGDAAELSIVDTGLPGRSSKMGPGVGRTLMTAFARQLRGEVSFRAQPDGGLMVRLDFPTPEYEPVGPAEPAAAAAAANDGQPQVSPAAAR